MNMSSPSLAGLTQLGVDKQVSLTSKPSLTAHVSWFVLGALLAFVVLYLLKPNFVRQKVNGEVTTALDTTRLVVSSLIGGLVIYLIAYLLMGRK
jgi:hypothetical protein